MRGPRWLQVNVVMPARPRDGRNATHAVFDAMFTLANHLRQEKRLRGFFFMRKPPGLTFRFAFGGPNGDARRAIGSSMQSLKRLKIIDRWFPSVYEPETFKFGGPAAMAAVHAHFNADSMAWWRWEQLRTTAKTTIASKLLSVAVLNDLFVRFVGGPEEVWDVWCRVAALHGAPVDGEGAAVPILGLEQLHGRVTAREQAVLRRYASGNRTLAHRFAAIHARGELLFAHRLVLPHVALYHWNRYGFSPEDRAAIFSPMVRAWCPGSPTAVARNIRMQAGANL